MDVAALAAALISSSLGQAQLGFADKMLKMNADQGNNAVKLIDAAQQNIDPLANVAAGLGTNLDVSA